MFNSEQHTSDLEFPLDHLFDAMFFYTEFIPCQVSKSRLFRNLGLHSLINVLLDGCGLYYLFIVGAIRAASVTVSTR